MTTLKNLRRRLSQVTSLTTVAKTATTNGTGVDLAGYSSATVLFVVGTITDGTHTPKVQESDDNATYTDVAAGDQEGVLANLATTTNQHVGYKGRKRYIRAVSTVAGATTGGVYGAVVLRGDPQSTPAP